MALLPYEAWEDLRTAYFAIHKCNYEAVRSMDYCVALNVHGDTPANQQRIMLAWKATSDEATYMAKSTSEYLQAISKKQWFEEARNWKPNLKSDER